MLIPVPSVSLTHVLFSARRSGESGGRASGGREGGAYGVSNTLDRESRKEQQEEKTCQLNSDMKSTSCSPDFGESEREVLLLEKEEKQEE